jgi:hypothetical protein
MMKPIGFKLSGHDNDTEMYSRSDPSLPRCPKCGYRLDFQAYNPEYSFKKSFNTIYMDELKISVQTAVTYTYDGQMIVTTSFKEFCDAQGYKGLIFRSFPKDPWHFQLIATRQVIIDQVQSRVRFGKLCPTCKNYHEINLTYDPVLKRAPVVLKQSELLSDGFYRSDLLFASGDNKSPLIIVGAETRDKLKAAKFKGLVFHPVHGLER